MEGRKQLRILILGGRQHAKVVACIAQEALGTSVTIVGFLDDDPALEGRRLLGIPVLGKLNDLEAVASRLNIGAILLGISNRHMDLRAELFARARGLGMAVPTIIHPKAFVSSRAEIGDGVVINPGVVVNAFAAVGSNCVIYSNSAIEHETRLEENVYIGPGVSFSSNARVGRNTFIGAGVSVIPDIRIGSNAVVGAGSVVIDDIPDNVTYAGVPARFINERKNTRI